MQATTSRSFFALRKRKRVRAVEPVIILKLMHAIRQGYIDALRHPCTPDEQTFWETQLFTPASFSHFTMLAKDT